MRPATTSKGAPCGRLVCTYHLAGHTGEVTGHSGLLNPILVGACGVPSASGLGFAPLILLIGRSVMTRAHAVGSIRRRGRRLFLPAVVGSVVLIGTLAAAAPPAPRPGAVTSITGQLNAVSAVSPSDAWAVGFTVIAGQPGAVPLIMHWNGTSWSKAKSPNIPFGELNGVSMVSATDGWAAGWSRNTGKIIILHWDGTSWTQVPGPAPDNGVLFGVSADSATDAWTAGPLSSERSRPAVMLHWDGTSWTRVPITVSGIFSDLDAVSAASASDAWIVGLVDQSQVLQSLALHWDGTSWTQVPAPSPGPESTLTAVSDASPGNAWAVGWADRTQDGTQTITLHWNGSAWQHVASPSPGHQIPRAGVIGNELTGVAITSRMNAWAVGDYTVNGTDRQAALTLHWNGSRWARVPNLGGTSDSFLHGISMVSATDGWAVGGHRNTGKIIILRWNGSTWGQP